jgi:hypothetical protein
MNKDFMYLVIDHTWGMNDELGKSYDKFSDKEEELIECLDSRTPNELHNKISRICRKHDIGYNEWLLLLIDYLKYNILYASETDKTNYRENLNCFAADKFALIYSVMSVVTFYNFTR